SAPSHPPALSLFPYTTLFRSSLAELADAVEALVLEICIAHRQCLIDNQHIGTLGRGHAERQAHLHAAGIGAHRLIHVGADFRKRDRKSTRLNSSHVKISYAVF